VAATESIYAFVDWLNLESTEKEAKKLDNNSVSNQARSEAMPNHKIQPTSFVGG
jgi:hypothetical protein